VIDARHYRAEDALPDGRPILIRAITPSDRQELRDGFHRLSEQSVYLRFFQPKSDLTDDELTYFTELDFRRHTALVAILAEGGDELGVGVGRYVVDEDDSSTAEVAFVVDDAHQGIGVGRTLMRHLATVARGNGITAFRATVLGENRRMLDALRAIGLRMSARLEHGVFDVLVTLAESTDDQGSG
jgi:GNAT superfamily N-acetyltransferase